MSMFVTLFTGTVRALLSVLQIAMLLRAVLSWFPLRDDNPILAFVNMVTEPIVAPIRALFDRMGWFRDFPLDMSFTAAFFLLLIVETLLDLFAR